MTDKIKAFKAFNKDWTCRGFQYELGKTYHHEGEVVACGSGFHSCEYPLDIFKYYNPCSSVFAEVTLSGKISKDDGDTKVASEYIELVKELDVNKIIEESITYTTSRCDLSTSEHATGYQSASSATGYRSASSATGYRSASSATGYQSASSATGYRSASSATGYQSASSATGDQSASSATGYRSASSATGYRSASSATGDQSASSATGDQSASSATGYRSASSATGYRSASSATGDRSASSATGDRSASSATGDRSASSATGYRSASSATGYRSASLTTGHYSSSKTTNDTKNPIYAAAISTGYCGRVMGTEGDALFLVERDGDGCILKTWSGIVGKGKVKPNTWYRLKNGKLTVALESDYE